MLAMLALPAAASAKPQFSAYDRWAINKCDHAVYVFHHPFKGMVEARPTRDWCKWTVQAAKQTGRKAGYATKPAVAKLVRLESGYSPTAQNPISSAYGLGQFLDSTWGTVGCRKTSNPTRQMVCMIRYVKKYGGMEGALRNHLLRNSY